MTATLQVRRLVLGPGKDKHGNLVETFGDPQEWVVRGYAPGANVENGDPHRDLSIILWTVYADSSPQLPRERDHVVLGGDEYAVEGRPGDWTHGPWDNPVAGVVVELKRAEG